MWTLYDPLARGTVRRGRSVQPKTDKAYQKGENQLPSTMQKLWFVLEPIGIVSCRSVAAFRNH